MVVATIEPDKLLIKKEKEGKKPLFLQTIGEEYIDSEPKIPSARSKKVGKADSRILTPRNRNSSSIL